MHRCWSTARKTPVLPFSLAMGTHSDNPSWYLLKSKLAPLEQQGRVVFYDYKKDDPENPLWSWVKKADAVVVAAISTSTIGEVIQTGKPVYLYA